MAFNKAVYDKDQGAAGPSRVSLASYIYLFNEIVRLTHDMPEEANSHSIWESRLAAMGHNVGVRTVGLALINDAHLYKRGMTCDDVVKFVSTVMFQRWFDRPAARHGAAERSMHYIEDEAPLIIPLRPSPKDYGDFHYGSFIGGMIKGSLEAAGFPATVQALYANDPPSPTTQYIIQWENSVLERERNTAASR